MATKLRPTLLLVLALAGLALHARGAVASSLDAPDERMDVIEDSIAKNTTTDAPPHHGRNLLSTPCRRRRSAAWLASHPRRTGHKEAPHHERPRLPWCDEVDQEAAVVVAAVAAEDPKLKITDENFRSSIEACQPAWSPAAPECDVTKWDVSAVTNMIGVFSNQDTFNEDISGWDVSSVTAMSGMFAGAAAFNQDINGWDVSKVKSMDGMFTTAFAFNKDISGWDVSSVTDMSQMFQGAIAFNQDISGWSITAGTDNDRFDTDTRSWQNDYKPTFPDGNLEP